MGTIQSELLPGGIETNPTAKEVAALLGINVQAIYLMKARVMRRLREEAQHLSDEFCFVTKQE